MAIGWVGAGKMGAPMIRNLLAQGQQVTVTEPSSAQRDGIVAAGAVVAHTLSDHAGSHIVFATLPNDAVLADVVIGKGDQPGLRDTMARGACFIEMSTVSPECSAHVAQALEEKGIAYLRAPVSGSTTLAEQATLTILTSGDRAAWEAALPFLEMMSVRQFYLGHREEARYMKLVLNTLVGASSAILSEALALGASGGLSHAKMMEVVNESAVASPLLKYKSEAIVSGDYAPAFTVDQMIKDFSLISDAARRNNIPLFTTGLILEAYRAASNSGLSDKDFFALVKWQSDMSPQ
ncbi:MAG: NAD(P)-dependent oxidoreductase [Pseudomonadota bacterium]